MSEVRVLRGRILVDGRKVGVEEPIRGAMRILEHGPVEVLRLEGGEPVPSAAGILAALASEGSAIVLGDLELRNPILYSRKPWVRETLRLVREHGRIPRGSRKGIYRRVEVLRRVGLLEEDSRPAGPGRPPKHLYLHPVALLII